MKLKEFGSPGGHTSLTTPLDPPLCHCTYLMHATCINSYHIVVKYVPVFQSCPMTFVHRKYWCPVVKAVGLGYGPNLTVVRLLRAGIHRLVLLPTDIAWDVMSNASSQTSSRWHMRCDITAYIISWGFVL